MNYLTVPTLVSTARGRNLSRKLPSLSLNDSREVLEQHAPDADIFAALAAERLAVKEAKLAADRAESEFLADLAERYRTGEVSQRDLARIYHGLRAFKRTGMATRWDRAIPFKRLLIEHQMFNEPHTDGRWYGGWPIERGDSVPECGQAVVYYLYDSEDVCCYIGSSGDLPSRLKWHRSDGKLFETWVAEPHQDREAAYRAEEALLQGCAVLPRYNVSVYR